MATDTIFRFSLRRATRPAALWGVLFGVLIASSAKTYVSSFPTGASRRALSHSFASNAGFAALFGIIRRIDTVAGYTAYKTAYTLIILGAIWGLFIATKLRRGEEEAGRLEVLLAGPTTRRRAAMHVALALGFAVVVLWIPTALLTVATGASKQVGIDAGAALFFATAMVCGAAMFMAVGLLTSELAATRHDANVIGAGVIAGSYLVRMVADSDPRLGWLRWASPFGWIEELHALVGPKPLAFVPIACFVGLVVAAALRLAAARDLGASVFASRDTPAPKLSLIGSQAGLTVRLTRPVVVAWLFVFAAVGLVFGLVTQAAGKALKVANGLDAAIARLGATHAGAVAYLGFVFLLAAGLVAVAVAGQISAMRNEEATGRLENLVVRPVARWQWLSTRVVLGASLVVVGSALVGVTAWLGAASQHAGISFVDLLKAGINVAPPAIFVLGVGVLMFGVLPRYAVAATYALVVWSFIDETIAALVNSNHWLRDTSPLAHITPAPAVAPNWTSAVWLIALGALLCFAGIYAFGRRDLQSF